MFSPQHRAMGSSTSLESTSTDTHQVTMRILVMKVSKTWDFHSEMFHDQPPDSQTASRLMKPGSITSCHPTPVCLVPSRTHPKLLTKRPQKMSLLRSSRMRMARWPIPACPPLRRSPRRSMCDATWALNLLKRRPFPKTALYPLRNRAMQTLPQANSSRPPRTWLSPIQPHSWQP